MKIIDNSFIHKNKNILAHKKAVFIVGAGISVSSGIPDFRSATGIFSTLRSELKVNGRDLFTYNFGIKEGTRQIYLKYISDLKRLCDGSSPNKVHGFLAAFPKSRIYTQNIDGLEERAGMVFKKEDSTKGVYLHGNLSKLNCQYCGYKREFSEEDLSRFSRAEEIDCSACLERRENCIKNNIRRRPIGVMHPGIIHYQQAHPDGAFIGRIAERDKDCDLLIVIGTSLKVEGIKKMVKMFAKYPNVCGKRIYVNLTKPTAEWEGIFDYFYEGDCNDFISAVELTIENVKKNDSIKKNITKNDSIDDTIKKNDPIVNSLIDNNITKNDATNNITIDSINNITIDSINNIENSFKRMSISFQESDENQQSKNSQIIDQLPLLSKLESLTDIFDNESAISKPVLNDILKQASPTKIQFLNKTDGSSISVLLDYNERMALSANNTFAEDNTHINNLPDSSFIDLEAELRNIVEDEAQLAIKQSIKKETKKSKKSDCK